MGVSICHSVHNKYFHHRFLGFYWGAGGIDLVSIAHSFCLACDFRRWKRDIGIAFPAATTATAAAASTIVKFV